MALVERVFLNALAAGPRTAPLNASGTTRSTLVQPMKRIAIIAALPAELRPLVVDWAFVPKSSLEASKPAAAASKNIKLWRRRTAAAELIAVCAGAGLGAARRAFAAAEALGPLDAVISVGWAGALSASYRPGRAFLLSGAVDAQTGEAFPTASTAGHGWVATSHRVAGLADKNQLASRYHADLVDMEAVAIGRLAAARGLPFYCIKAVSDGVADHFPDFNCFIGKSGQFKLVRFIIFAALRPWWWSALRRLDRQSQQAAHGLNLRLGELLRELTGPA